MKEQFQQFEFWDDGDIEHRYCKAQRVRWDSHEFTALNYKYRENPNAVLEIRHFGGHDIIFEKPNMLVIRHPFRGGLVHEVDIKKIPKQSVIRLFEHEGKGCCSWSERRSRP